MELFVLEVKSTSADVIMEVRLESPSQAEAQAALIEARQGDPVPVPAGGCRKITVNTTIDSMLHPPVKSADHLWFDPQDATGLGRVRLRQGDEDFKKDYRFTKQGVFRHQKEPKDQKEASTEPDQWTKVIDTFYSYDADRLGCPNIVDRLLMIYIASTSGMLKNNQPLWLCVFGKRQLFRVKLRPAGLHPLRVDYMEKKAQGEDRRQYEVKAVRIDLEAKALAINPVTPTTLYAGTIDGGMFKSMDGGENWSAASTGFTSTAVGALVLDPLMPDTLYVGTNGDGVFKSMNGGGIWSVVNTGLTATDVRALAIDPATPSTVYAGTFGGGVFSIQMVTAPANVAIAGLTAGVTHNTYGFTASVEPLTTTIPVTYVWEATGQAPVTIISNLTSTVTVQSLISQVKVHTTKAIEGSKEQKK